MIKILFVGGPADGQYRDITLLPPFIKVQHEGKYHLYHGRHIGGTNIYVSSEFTNEKLFIKKLLSGYNPARNAIREVLDLANDAQALVKSIKIKLGLTEEQMRENVLRAETGWEMDTCERPTDSGD